MYPPPHSPVPASKPGRSFTQKVWLAVRIIFAASLAVIAGIGTAIVLPFVWAIDVLLVIVAVLATAFLRARLIERRQRRANSAPERPTAAEPASPATPPLTVASLPSDGPSQVLYRETRHGKYLAKRLVIPGLIGLLGLMPTIGWLLLPKRMPLPSNPQLPEAIQIPAFLGLLPFSLTLFILIGVGFSVFRRWYGWRHTYLVITRQAIRLVKPRNRLLIYGGGQLVVPLSGIRVWNVHPQNGIESTFRLNCSSVTFDSEADRDKELHDMTDVRKPQEIEAIMEQLLPTTQHVPGGVTPELIAEGIRLARQRHGSHS